LSNGKRAQAVPADRFGNDFPLNHSLASDGVSLGWADAFRNLPIEHLLMYASPGRRRAGNRVSASRALEWVSSGRSGAVESASTDAVVSGQLSSLAGARWVDVDSAEELSAAAKKGFFTKRHAFVEDGAVGSTRDSELKVRLIADRAEPALAFRHLLQATPLYDPDWFPRNVVVVWDSEAPAGAGGPTVVSDVDLASPSSAKAWVTVRGEVPLERVLGHVALVSAKLLQNPASYRGVDGGSQAQRAVKARNGSGGAFDASEFHWLPARNAPLPDNVLVPGDVVFSKASGRTAVLLSLFPTASGLESAVAAAADAAGAHHLVWAAKHFVWGAGHLARFWDAVPRPLHDADRAPRGAAVVDNTLLHGGHATPQALEAAVDTVLLYGPDAVLDKLAPSPAANVDPKAAADALCAAIGLDPKGAGEKLAARLAAAKAIRVVRGGPAAAWDAAAK
jgi:hypothetical protein